jgi:E3 ubiquitin-protein ligase HECTD3
MRRTHKSGGHNPEEDALDPLPTEERHLFSQLSIRILEDLINEYRRPVEMIREGITQIVPLSVLRACHWADIETRICGSPEVSVDGLKHWLETRSFSGPHLQNFWKAISDMSNLQRSQLLQFSVGQRRLPLKQRIRVTLDPTSAVYFPTSSTCFSQLTIPRCSSSEELLGRLIYAITNAVSIDADEQRVTTVLRVGT